MLACAIYTVNLFIASIDASRRVILSAMREWEESLPCIKWRVKTADDVDFVHFFKGDG